MEGIPKRWEKKWELALELIDQALTYGFELHVILFDSWFCVNPFVKALVERELTFISEMKSNNVAEFCGLFTCSVTPT